VQIPEEELKKGVELCFKNANSFIEDAKTLSDKKSYGHARFLALSAIEEINKAFICTMKKTNLYHIMTQSLYSFFAFKGSLASNQRLQN
jgi:AbiV family abortive infection protein